AVGVATRTTQRTLPRNLNRQHWSTAGRILPQAAINSPCLIPGLPTSALFTAFLAARAGQPRPSSKYLAHASSSLKELRLICQAQRKLGFAPEPPIPGRMASNGV